MTWKDAKQYTFLTFADDTQMRGRAPIQRGLDRQTRGKGQQEFNEMQ